MSEYEIKIINIDLLKPHEKIVECHLIRLAEEIKKEGRLKDPVIVDKKTLVILDGHHRWNALKRLGFNSCPVCLVDYNDDAVKVECWQKGDRISKADVISAGLSGKLMEPKTSKHEIPGRPTGLNMFFDHLR
jgi:L-serine kinase (ADP)